MDEVSIEYVSPVVCVYETTIHCHSVRLAIGKTVVN